ncbi:MAG: TrmB family transcriptional regulator [Candidatus Aenigmatarchaeota archaeon]
MNITDMLKEIGLNSYEARCYLALWRYGTQSARECASRAKVPKTKVHEVLRSLEEKGLIMVQEEKPKRFRALPLKKGLISFISSKETKLEEIKKELNRSLSKISRVKPKEPEEKIITVFGKPMKLQLALEFTRSAIKELLIISGATKIRTSLLLETKKASKRGVNVKYIATKEDPEFFRNLKTFGYKVRFKETDFLFFAVRDRKQSMLVVKNPKDPEETISILISDENLSRMHAAFFDSLWKQAKTL